MKFFSDLESEPSAQPAVLKTAGVVDKDAFNSSTINVASLTSNLVIFVLVLSMILCL